MTVVEWLHNQLLEGRHHTDKEYETIITKAKEIEKEQIERAFNESRLTHPMIGFKHETFKDYWNETNP